MTAPTTSMCLVTALPDEGRTSLTKPRRPAVLTWSPPRGRGQGLFAGPDRPLPSRQKCRRSSLLSRRARGVEDGRGAGASLGRRGGDGVAGVPAAGGRLPG